MSLRVSVRFSPATSRARRIWSTAGLEGAVRSAACNSIPMLASPCATVSWISPANRARSASRPTSRSRAASAERVATSSAITSRRAWDSRCSARTPAPRPRATSAPTVGPMTPAGVNP